ncbi:hypothetical protein [Pseudothauera rhizosphaerae]|uniref:Uncharacterized protein n=1 Tax=Pseudothauera rhizosphaerae TaxID=2565932 RepID=A0A4S4APN1_9RHOO|nr:hypothetical protein [Pseudothauera rhizosphaerae]THF61655.1 hypothetical protein E6O51_09395 [Pseudothauera rhizosphaerae]
MSGEEPILSSNLAFMVQAMRPVARRLSKRLTTPAPRTVFEADMAGEAYMHVRTFGYALERISTAVNDLMEHVVGNAGSGEPEAQRWVGRLEAAADMAVGEYEWAESLSTAGDDMLVHDLLSWVCRHNLDELRDWLDQLIHTLDDPLGVIWRNGAPSDRPVELSVPLTFTEPPALERLRTVLAAREPHKSGIGLMGTLGLGVLGYWVVDCLSGDDE